MSDIYQLGTQTGKPVALERLRESEIDSNSIAIPLREGTKQPIGEWKDEENRVSLSQAPQNYAVYPEGDLAFVDIDDEEKAPQQLLDGTMGTFTVDSPHGEHRWILINSDIPNITREWGEIRVDNQYVVGPGSKLFDCDHGCCSNDNPSHYTIKDDSPILKGLKSGFEEILGDSLTPEKNRITSANPNLESLPEIPRERRKLAETCLQTIQQESTAFARDLEDRLNGDMGDMDNTLAKDGSARTDTSRHDFVTIEHLYGVFRYHGLADREARELTYDYFSHCCNEYPYTNDGQSRKWTYRDERYRREMVRYASRAFDESRFRRLLNKTTHALRAANMYSDITYGYVRFVLDWLIEGYEPNIAREYARSFGLVIDRETLLSVYPPALYQDTTPFGQGGGLCDYPTPKCVRELCSELDSRSTETYKTVLQRLRRDGHIKLAYLGGNDYRVYPVHQEDPPEAEWVKCGGEKYEPKVAVEAKVAPKIEA